MFGLKTALHISKTTPPTVVAASGIGAVFLSWNWDLGQVGGKYEQSNTNQCWYKLFRLLLQADDKEENLKGDLHKKTCAVIKVLLLAAWKLF